MKNKYTDQQIKEFMSQTTQELVIQDPKPILDDIGVWYKELGNNSYQLNVRDENTPSAYISLRHGKWSYKDFGSGNNGNITNVVMDYTGKNYKEALTYSLQTLGVPNRLEEALSSVKQDYSLSQADKERLKAQREANKKREQSVPLSKVTKTYEVSTNQLAIDYLASRGISKIPPNFKIINGEYTNKNGEVKRAFGVGILTQDGTGADIHFLKKVGDLKTMSFGEKDISFFKNPNSKKVAIFESKMDYAAAYQQMPLDDVNVIIGNSSGNHKKVADLLRKENLTKEVMFFNQNDLAGYKFVKDVANDIKVDTFKSIAFNTISEYGKDI
ncbi:MAG: hypothetical protein U9R50_11675, partial [Campylobacterota bacterium]|nr:hypothetical protein [Campylobacterota bacterium]